VPSIFQFHFGNSALDCELSFTSFSNDLTNAAGGFDDDEVLFCAIIMERNKNMQR